MDPDGLELWASVGLGGGGENRDYGFNAMEECTGEATVLPPSSPSAEIHPTHSVTQWGHGPESRVTRGSGAEDGLEGTRGTPQAGCVSLSFFFGQILMASFFLLSAHSGP